MPWSKLSNFLERHRQRGSSSREESMVSSTTTKATIIVPLYIYPQPGAWEPLYESIQKYTETHFLVIVNPGNGPGPDAVPDENYLSEIPKLTAYPNVEVVGYVHTTFARRELSAVLDDVGTYSNWAGQAQYPGLGINGIFVDETPNQYDARAEKFLSDLTSFAKRCNGFGGNKLVIHNPGCVPTPAYMAIADITVVFEDTWQTFNTRVDEGLFDQQRLFDGDSPMKNGNSGREKLAIMIHSVPKDQKSDLVKNFVKKARETADVIFVTDLNVNYYSNWSPKWKDWVNLIASE